MPYTLAMGIGWVLAGIVLGVVVGYLLRSVTARRQVRLARTPAVEQAEVERLRGRVANLEDVVAERDRLREALAAAGLTLDPTGEIAVVPASLDGPAAPGSTDVLGVGAGDTAPPTPDVAEAERVLGRPVVLDDLTVIEGLGPAVEELCHGIGIRTWWDLARTEASLLRTMLDDAGARYQVNDPSLWPEQARLLAEGRWAEFAELAASSRPVDEPDRAS